MSVPGEQPIAAVAKLTGVSVDTLRAWERRHRLVKPRRDGAGNRRYSERDIRRIALAQTAVRLGYAIGRVARLGDAEIERIIREQQHRESREPPPLSPSNTAAEGTVAAVYDAIRQFDVGAAGEKLRSASLLLGASELVLEVLVPLLQRVGEGSSDGEIGVGQERALSNLIRDLIGTLRRTHSSSAATVVLATPPDELHDLSLGLAACLLAVNGAQSILLGAQVPPGEIVSFAGRLAARAVVISLTIEQLPGIWETYLRILDMNLPPQTALWILGPGAERLRNMPSARIARFPTLDEFSRYVQAQRRIWFQ